MYKGLLVFLFAASAFAFPVSAQNVFVSDSSGIAEYTPGGTETNFYSGDIAFDDMAFDSAGDLFATANSANAVYEFQDIEGTLSATPTLFASGLNDPTSLAFSSGGNLLVINTGQPNGNSSTTGTNHGIVFQYADTDGILSSTPTDYVGTFAHPNGLAFYGDNLYVGDYLANTITQVTPGPVDAMGASIFTSNAPSVFGLAFDASGNLYATSVLGGTIYEFAPNGTRTTFATGVSVPTNLAFDSEGDLFATVNGKVDEFVDDDGILDSTPITFATLSGDQGIAIQPLAAPEPSSWLLVGLGGLLLYLLRVRGRKLLGRGELQTSLKMPRGFMVLSKRFHHKKCGLCELTPHLLRRVYNPASIACVQRIVPCVFMGLSGDEFRSAS